MRERVGAAKGQQLMVKEIADEGNMQRTGGVEKLLTDAGFLRRRRKTYGGMEVCAWVAWLVHPSGPDMISPTLNRVDGERMR